MINQCTVYNINRNKSMYSINEELVFRVKYKMINWITVYNINDKSVYIV